MRTIISPTEYIKLNEELHALLKRNAEGNIKSQILNSNFLCNLWLISLHIFIIMSDIYWQFNKEIQVSSKDPNIYREITSCYGCILCSLEKRRIFFLTLLELHIFHWLKKKNDMLVSSSLHIYFSPSLSSLNFSSLPLYLESIFFLFPLNFDNEGCNPPHPIDIVIS